MNLMIYTAFSANAYLRTSLFTTLFLLNILCFSDLSKAEDSSVIMKRLDMMEKEIISLKAQLKEAKNVKEKNTVPADTTVEPSLIDEDAFKPQSQNAARTSQNSEALTKRLKELGPFGITYRSDGLTADTLRLGAYGESIMGRKQSGNGWNNGFDANRLVLLGTYPVNEDIIFNMELEFEHGGIAKDADDKLNGAIEVEQLFIDLKGTDYFTFRSPGVDVVPVGYVGLFHEPTQFYSTNRPEIYDGLIPSTWFAPSTGAYGKIIDGLNYQFQISSGLEDAGTVAEDEDGAVPDGGYDPGISGSEALGLARAPIGDRLQLGNNLAYAFRLSYTPYVIPGLSGSSSIYYTSNTTPRGAYGTNANGSTRQLGKSDLGMFDTELRYRMPETGLELRTEYVRSDFGDPDNLRANNDGDPSNNVGNDMYGYSFEGAYHFPLSAEKKESWDFVPFYRYSRIELQTSGVHGTDDNTPSGSGSKKYHTFGAALFPTPKVVFKLDYQLIDDEDEQSPIERALLAAVGFFF